MCFLPLSGLKEVLSTIVSCVLAEEPFFRESYATLVLIDVCMWVSGFSQTPIGVSLKMAMAHILFP